MHERDLIKERKSTSETGTQALSGFWPEMTGSLGSPLLGTLCCPCSLLPLRIFGPLCGVLSQPKSQAPVPLGVSLGSSPPLCPLSWSVFTTPVTPRTTGI